MVGKTIQFIVSGSQWNNQVLHNKKQILWIPVAKWLKIGGGHKIHIESVIPGKGGTDIII